MKNFWIAFIIPIVLFLSRSGMSQNVSQQPADTLIELIQEVKVTCAVDSIQNLRRGMAVLAKPGEEKTMILSIDFPKESESITFSDAAPGKHSYDISRKINISWNITHGNILKTLEQGVVWKSPDSPGDFKIRMVYTEERRSGQDDTFTPVQKYIGQIELVALVQYPFDPKKDSAIEGYPIGVYPDEGSPSVGEPVASHRAQYTPPRFFVKVNSGNENLAISPHFKLGDFSCPWESGKTRFVAIEYSLVKRLEQIIEALNNNNMAKRGIKIIRAYISPIEKERLKREGVHLSDFTRFLYGDSASFIVDDDGDNKMDDLNNDGKIDVADAEFLAEIAEQIEAESGSPGGIGIYSNFKDIFYQDTPYVQVDTRGWRSRWHFATP